MTKSKSIVLKQLHKLLPYYNILGFSSKECEIIWKEFKEDKSKEYKPYEGTICTFGPLIHKTFFYNTSFPFEELFYFLIGYLDNEDEYMMANRIYNDLKLSLERHNRKYPLYKRLVFLLLYKFKRFFLGESLFKQSFITKLILKIPFIYEWCKKQYP